ncbi:hypothetical protein ID866_8932 [Astraeus odoratus]|nr:hypothetical protein ID866_8932 [Astraeus odoratus]
MSIGGYKVMFQKGITGGFAPPTPSVIHHLAVNDDSTTLTITSLIRPHGQPQPIPQPPKALSVASGDHAASLERLRDILSKIPPQFPGADDLYKQDISILAVGEGVVPYGTAVARNLQPPTDEQVQQFNQAVDIVNRLVAAAE